MKEKLTQKTSVPSDMTLIEEFMSECYQFRKNALSDKYEMREVSEPTGDDNNPSQPHWRPVTREGINSIMRRIRRELGEDEASKSAVEEYIYSEETPSYDPIAEYFDYLPIWDGKDRAKELFERLPGVNEEQVARLKVWARSTVAHWLQIDTLHGNEQVLTLIGPQGCGKSTFCARLLPPELRTYYLDYVNLGNKFDKEMALTNNLLVNLDELDQIKLGKQPELKQMLSKIKVNGRPIYGRSQSDRKRYASFTATTNNPRPLSDPTGSRRYLCVEIPRDSIICNDRPIEYEQLYAQLKYEVMEQHLPYWFTLDEVRRIEQLNQKFQHADDLESMIESLFRHPMAQESVTPMLVSDVVQYLVKAYPDLHPSRGMTIKVGRVLKMLQFEKKDLATGSAYYLVPIDTAV